MLSPIRRVAATSVLNAATASSPTVLTMSLTQASAGFCQLAFLTKAAVGAAWEFSATCVRPLSMRSRVSVLAATTGSQPMMRSAPAMPTRVVRMASCEAPISTWLQVAPPFCASPPASCVTMPLPSRCAAMPSNWPMVITPVPPTPATTMPQPWPSWPTVEAIVGSGNAPHAASNGDGPWPFDFFLS